MLRLFCRVRIGVLFLARQVHIYPNPSEDVIHIQSPMWVSLKLTSMEGRIIRELNEAHSLSLKDLANGIYLLHVYEPEGGLIKTEKIIKQ